MTKKKLLKVDSPDAAPVVAPKHLFASKTFWFAVIQFLVAFLTQFGVFLSQNTELSWSLVITGALTIAFRVWTTQPVTLSRQV